MDSGVGRRCTVRTWVRCVGSGQPVKEPSGPRLAYRIAMGVRDTDQEWKRQLNCTIQENQPPSTGYC